MGGWGRTGMGDNGTENRREETGMGEMAWDGMRDHNSEQKRVSVWELNLRGVNIRSRKTNVCTSKPKEGGAQVHYAHVTLEVILLPGVKKCKVQGLKSICVRLPRGVILLPGVNNIQ